jgi:hypothetical protein
LSGSGVVRVPVSLAAAIHGRLAGLAEDSVRVLRWAALLGLEFSVADLGARLLAGDTDPQRVADTSWLVAFATIRAGRRAEAQAQITQGLAGPGLTGSQRARLRALHAMTLNSTGMYDRAEDTARQALAEAGQAGDRLAAGYALHVLSSVSFYRREPAARLEYIDRALSLVEMDPQATDLRLLLLANKVFHLTDHDRRAEAMTVGSLGRYGEKRRGGCLRVLAVSWSRAACSASARDTLARLVG